MYANITGSVSEYLLRSRKRLNLRFILFQVPIYKFNFSRGFLTLSFVVIEILNYAQTQIFQPISSSIGTEQVLGYFDNKNKEKANPMVLKI